MVFTFVTLFLAGLLAGEEFVVRYGIRGSLARLEDRPHIEFRQSLIRTLRVLVPAMAVPAFVLSVVAGILDGEPVWWVGAAALLAWFLVTFFGTVPINAAALDWRSDAPPSDWKARVDRWERLNTLRTWLALLAFVCFLGGVAVGVPV
jgi:uncharacterized membrane protein